MQLAELNLGRIRWDIDDPRMAGFRNNLDRINGLAERSPGFIWRLEGEGGNATDLRIVEDPLVISNVSVWESVEALEAFVFKTLHVQFYGKRSNWFDRMPGPHFVMWWVEDGHRPTLEEAADRLRRLEREGPSPDAFGWEARADLAAWQAKRCA